MNNLLFYTLLGLTAYYFMVYLPNQKSSPAPKSFTSSSTQTEPISPETVQLPSDYAIPDPETITKLEAEKAALVKDQTQKERTILGLNRSYEKLEQTKSKEIKELKEQIRELKKQLTQVSQSQKSEQQELEKTLDTLIKGMNQLSEEIDKS